MIIRFLFGIGEGNAYSNTSIVIAHWFLRNEIGKAQALIWAAGKIGGALTPLILVPLVHIFGWRYTFFLLGILGIVWAIICYMWFRN